MIRLDTRAIRRKALRDYQKAQRNLDGLKSQLKRYHEEDVPGFRAWASKTFGHLLSRQRELQLALGEKRSFLAEIEALAQRYGISYADACRKALWRRAHPQEAEQEDRRWEEEELAALKAERGIGDDAEDPTDEDLFDDGLFADEEFDIPEEERASFSDFFEEMTGIRPPAGAFRGARSRPPGADKSVKELYRTIVRRLHPDRHGPLTEARKNLWHEAQEAYRRHDLAALYSILARCDDGEAGLGDHTPVALIRRLSLQLSAAARAARSEVHRMKRDAAWDYARRTSDPRFVERIGWELREVVRNLEWDLDSVTTAFAQLERQATRPVRASRRRRGGFLDADLDLPF